MKKIIGWPVTWLLYWMGDIVSKPIYLFDCMAWLYPVYNRLMHWSGAVQDWACLKAPWSEKYVMDAEEK